MTQNQRSVVFPAALAILWLALAILALGMVEKRAGTAGDAGHPPPRLPAHAVPAHDPGKPFDPGKPSLVMLIHPHCPCSRASLTELSRLAALCPGRANLSVLLLRPPGCPAAFTDTDLRRQAAAIPGVAVQTDDAGATAQRLGAATSGETLLYSADGRLLFHGGLTAARGHEGDSAGVSAVAALLNGHAAPADAPVYGCPLTADRRDKSRCPRLGGGAAWLP